MPQASAAPASLAKVQGGEEGEPRAPLCTSVKRNQVEEKRECRTDILTLWLFLMLSDYKNICITAYHS